jgi:hypothetical protein
MEKGNVRNVERGRVEETGKVGRRRGWMGKENKNGNRNRRKAKKKTF